MNIPKIIHHIAPQDSSRWHPLWARCRQSWLDQFAGFKFRLWNDADDIDELVRGEYPQYWQLYQDFPAHIMRIDFARFCILHHHGGIYADMDVYCYQNFYSEIHQSFMVVEAPYGDVFLENALMASIPAHELWLECMQLSHHIFRERVSHHPIQVPFNHSKKDQLIMTMACGPHLVAKIVRQHIDDPDVGTFPALTYNNHGLSYDPAFRTKHVMTGLWGKESIDAISASDKHQDLQQILANGWLREANQYCDLGDITVNDFDFYHDYTNGGYLRSVQLDINKNMVDDVDNGIIDYGT
jgi:hypothetical protein